MGRYLNKWKLAVRKRELPPPELKPLEELKSPEELKKELEPQVFRVNTKNKWDDISYEL